MLLPVDGIGLLYLVDGVGLLSPGYQYFHFFFLEPNAA